MISDTILKKIAIRSKGDVRSSINDLQTIAIGEKEIDVDKLDYREREESIFNLLQLIFKSQDINSINRSIDNVNLGLDEIFLWIEENLPNEYYNKELFESFERLSKADVFRGRIRRNQYWRFLIYQKLLMGVGVSLAKNSKKNEVVKYSRPQRILKLWRAKLKYSERKIKAEQISKENGQISSSSLPQKPINVPFLKVQYCNLDRRLYVSLLFTVCLSVVQWPIGMEAWAKIGCFTPFTEKHLKSGIF